MDGLDITPLLVILKSINPAYAAAALAVWVIVQKVRSQGGLQLGKGGLLAILAQILGKHTPAAPDAKDSDKPKADAPDQYPDIVDDERERLLEILAKRLKERLRMKVAEDEDDHAVIAHYAKMVKAIDADEVK